MGLVRAVTNSWACPKKLAEPMQAWVREQRRKYALLVPASAFANTIETKSSTIYTVRISGASSVEAFLYSLIPLSAGDHWHAAGPASGGTAGAEGGSPAAQGRPCCLPEGQDRPAEAGTSFLLAPQPFLPTPFYSQGDPWSCSLSSGQRQATELHAELKGVQS